MCKFSPTTYMLLLYYNTATHIFERRTCCIYAKNICDRCSCFHSLQCRSTEYRVIYGPNVRWQNIRCILNGYPYHVYIEIIYMALWLIRRTSCTHCRNKLDNIPSTHMHAYIDGVSLYFRPYGASDNIYAHYANDMSLDTRCNNNNDNKNIGNNSMTVTFVRCVCCHITKLQLSKNSIMCILLGVARRFLRIDNN